MSLNLSFSLGTERVVFDPDVVTTSLDEESCKGRIARSRGEIERLLLMTPKDAVSSVCHTGLSRCEQALVAEESGVYSHRFATFLALDSLCRQYETWVSMLRASQPALSVNLFRHENFIRSIDDGMWDFPIDLFHVGKNLLVFQELNRGFPLIGFLLMMLLPFPLQQQAHDVRVLGMHIKQESWARKIALMSTQWLEECRTYYDQARCHTFCTSPAGYQAALKRMSCNISSEEKLSIFAQCYCSPLSMLLYTICAIPAPRRLEILHRAATSQGRWSTLGARKATALSSVGLPVEFCDLFKSHERIREALATLSPIVHMSEDGNLLSIDDKLLPLLGGWAGPVTELYWRHACRLVTFVYPREEVWEPVAFETDARNLRATLLSITDIERWRTYKDHCDIAECYLSVIQTYEVGLDAQEFSILTSTLRSLREWSKSENPLLYFRLTLELSFAKFRNGHYTSIAHLKSEMAWLIKSCGSDSEMHAAVTIKARALYILAQVQEREHPLSEDTMHRQDIQAPMNVPDRGDVSEVKRCALPYLWYAQAKWYPRRPQRLTTAINFLDKCMAQTAYMTKQLKNDVELLLRCLHSDRNDNQF